jgi:ubiquinone/menaquinone biosynthesis C-methylase UbiE
MKLLNVGCGGQRPQDEHWWNLDTLREFLKEGTPERINLDQEPRYIECSLLLQSIPFPDETFDGILLQHVLEHFTCHETTEVLIKCRAVLRTGGVLVASVPDVSYFRKWHRDDTRDNAVKIFGESISGDWEDSQCKSFFEYALWHRQHKQILSWEGLWATLRRAGFEDIRPWESASIGGDLAALMQISTQLNRKRFSTIQYAYK